MADASKGHFYPAASEAEEQVDGEIGYAAMDLAMGQ
jgi:hypothetical protein